MLVDRLTRRSKSGRRNCESLVWRLEEPVALPRQNQFSSAGLRGFSVTHLKSDFGDRRDQSAPNARIRGLKEEHLRLERPQRIQKGNVRLRYLSQISFERLASLQTCPRGPA